MALEIGPSIVNVAMSTGTPVEYAFPANATSSIMQNNGSNGIDVRLVSGTSADHFTLSSGQSLSVFASGALAGKSYYFNGTTGDTLQMFNTLGVAD